MLSFVANVNCRLVVGIIQDDSSTSFISRHIFVVFERLAMPAYDSVKSNSMGPYPFLTPPIVFTPEVATMGLRLLGGGVIQVFIPPFGCGLLYTCVDCLVCDCVSDLLLARIFQ